MSSNQIQKREKKLRTILESECLVCNKIIGKHTKSQADRCADITEIYGRVLRAFSK